MAVEGWIPLGASVRGAQHVRSEKPNQDALRWAPHPTSDGGAVVPPLSLCVSDGHGSPHSFRSDAGSRFAVEVATNVLHRFLQKNEESSLIAVKRLAEETIPNRIVREWQVAVDRDLYRRPISEKERELAAATPSDDPHEASPGPGADGPGETEADTIRRAYGATLLATAISSRYILHVQVGDGDILLVSQKGEVGRAFSEDEVMPGEGTRSLCAPRAWDHFRVSFAPLEEDALGMVALSTDGLSKSFPKEADFRGSVLGIYEEIRRTSSLAVGEKLPKTLDDATRMGSGDDITLGLVVRASTVDPGARLQHGAGPALAPASFPATPGGSR